MVAVSERLLALANERDALAERSRELEAALAATSQEAQRRAAEAVQLRALLDFYEQELPTDARSSPAVSEAPVERESERPPQPPAASAAVTATPTPVRPRGTSSSWTSAWRDAAIAALHEQTGPMHYRELYRFLAGRGFAFGGKSPEATFLASLHRERSTFRNAGKGLYGLVEPAEGAPPVSAPPKRRGARRPQPIGRAGRSAG